MPLRAHRTKRPASFYNRFHFTREFEAHGASRTSERGASLLNYLSQYPEEVQMPVILAPVLWVGGAIVLLGGGWYVIGHMVH
jgi:hypothetical protein